MKSTGFIKVLNKHEVGKDYWSCENTWSRWLTL